MATVPAGCTVQEAAQTLVAQNTDILSVLSPQGQVVGIVTDWDITRAASRAQVVGEKVEAIMTRAIISGGPQDSVLDAVLKLEQHDISALPVLSPEGRPLGVITADLLATRTLYRLLLGEAQT
jgi:CBS domain-containing protein